MDDLAEHIKKNPKRALAVLPPSKTEHSMTHEEVRKARVNNSEHIIAAARATGKILALMNMHIICAPENSFFITSDHPCIVFDPIHNKHIALGSPSVEVTLPISPKQAIIFLWADRTHQPEYSYTQATENVVDEFNRRTRFCCDEYFIANNKSKKDYWFEVSPK